MGCAGVGYPTLIGCVGGVAWVALRFGADNVGGVGAVVADSDGCCMLYDWTDIGAVLYFPSSWHS